MHTLIIAEAGVNHNGDMNIAKKLIEVAAEAKADYVKFQTFNVDLLKDEAERERLRPYQLTIENHKELVSHCERVGIKFLSTPFDIQSVDLLVSLGVDRIKVPSGEITNTSYLRHIGRQQLPIILSTGMADLNEVSSAMCELESSGAHNYWIDVKRPEITVLHCTSEYPTQMPDVNLRAMLVVQEYRDVPVGYSDHTLSLSIGACAVAMGATVIEKHFTLDRSMPGPDHQASLMPSELKIYIEEIRSIELALGDGVKLPTKSELAKRDKIRNRFVL